jgi:carboxyl-terminal processing protease
MNERRNITDAVWVLTVLGVLGCGDELGGGPRDGVYRSVGYGFVVELRGGTVTVLDRDDVACRTGAGAIVAEDEIRQAFAAATFDSRGLTVRFPWAATPTHFERLAALPDACAAARTPIAGEPGYGADAGEDARVLCAELAEHYAFARERGVDLRAACDALIEAPGASAEEAFAHMVAVLAPLEDPHVSLVDPATQRSFSGGAVPRIVSQALAGLPADADDDAQAAALAATVDTIVRAREGYLDAPAETPIPRVLSAGTVGGRTGYIALDALQLRASLDFPDQADTLAAALDQVLAPLHDLPALILDLRANGGGSDRLSVAVAQRFATRALRVKKRVYEGGKLLDPRTIEVPADAHAYRGELVILTSDLTVSAAEVLTLLLAGRPRTRRLGDTTAGAFSDALYKTLPNGWLVTLSNERYEDEAGHSYEAEGLAPDVPTPAYSLVQLEAGHDAALEAALALVAR